MLLSENNAESVARTQSTRKLGLNLDHVLVKVTTVARHGGKRWKCEQNHKKVLKSSILFTALHID